MQASRRIAVIGIIVLSVVTVMATSTRDSVAAVAATSRAQGTVKVDPEVVAVATQEKISTQEAERHLQWQRKAPAFGRDLQKALGKKFGGIWIDPADGDRLKVGVVGGNADIRALAQRRGLEDAADLVPVRYSLGLLETAIGQIGDELVRINKGAAWPLEAGLQTSNNVVEIRSARNHSLTPAQQAVIDAAKRRYGAAVRLGVYDGRYEARICNELGPECDPPLRGGIRFYSNYGGRCTAAFNAKSKIDNRYYLMTAGHCGGNRNVEVWTANDAEGFYLDIGPYHRWIWDGTGDMAIVRNWDNVGTWGHARAIVLSQYGPYEEFLDLYSINADDYSTEGQRICSQQAYYQRNVRYGYTTCAKVVELDVTMTYGGVTVNHLGRANPMDVITGASGSPMFSYGIAYGILAAANSDTHNVLYQGIKKAEETLNVKVIF